MNEILLHLQNQLPAMTQMLTQLVDMESPTSDKEGVDRVGAFISNQMHVLGAAVQVYPQTQTGNHILGVWNKGAFSPILLLLHMDTVHPLGSIVSRPIHITDGVFYGPGCCDMKASHVIALYAIKAVIDCCGGLMREVRVLCTSDEETGSLTSRELIESMARDTALTMVMEPALPDGRLKSSRKGVGEFRVTAHGKTSHAGGAHSEGVNAIEELAYQVLFLQGLTDYSRGITLSVGEIHGGGVVNVVPDYATCQVDVRVQHAADASVISNRITNLEPVLRRSSLTIDGSFNRPPMECTPQRLEIINKIKSMGSSLGLSIDHGASGGGSDASFTASLGIPTMDGFGAVGDGLHAMDEHVVLASLPERAALTAAVIQNYRAD
jgi:glutamate carboxypeptidase